MVLRYKGCACFRQRLICATLSGKPIRIDEIRAMDERPGLRDYEASFLRLLEKFTKGSVIQISETGTSIQYKPGVIVGGMNLRHDCGTNRGVGYFLEAVLALAPWGKQQTSITLVGITNHPKDITVDTFRNTTLQLFKYFGFEDLPTLQVVKRGAPPSGGGEVRLTVPIVKQLKAMQLLNEGMIKRIRGIAYSTRVAPTIANRIVESSRGLFNNWIPDVWIYTDHYSGSRSGASPGYGIFLQAESDTGCSITTELTANAGDIPEELGKNAAKLLCEEIKKGGCIDSNNQWLMFLMMALCPEDVSKLRIGKLSPYGVQYLRHLRDFFGVVFKLVPEPETATVVVSCMGSGFKNISKKSN